MERKRTIVVLLTVVFGVALFSAVVLFAVSLRPSAKAEIAARDYIVVQDLSPGDYTFSHANGGPYFVEMLDTDQYRVMRLVPMFTNPAVRGATIRLDLNQWDQREGCVFFESARGVCYDYDGKVLRGSYPGAVDMKELEWRYRVAGRAIELLNDAR